MLIWTSKFSHLVQKDRIQACKKDNMMLESSNMGQDVMIHLTNKEKLIIPINKNYNNI